MKKIRLWAQVALVFCLIFVSLLSVSAQGYVPTYWEVYKVFDINGRELEDDMYNGFPISVQTGGSSLVGFNAYVNFGGFGNDVLEMTGQTTRNGGVVYMNYIGNYVVMNLKTIVYKDNSLKRIFIAKPTDIQNFHKKMANIHAIMNPYGGGSHDSKSNKGSYSKGRQCPGCNGTGKCAVCNGKGWYRNQYDSNPYNRYDCFECRGYGYCQVCHGKGYISY